jgi:hypothetical protein
LRSPKRKQLTTSLKLGFDGELRNSRGRSRMLVLGSGGVENCAELDVLYRLTGGGVLRQIRRCGRMERTASSLGTTWKWLGLTSFEDAKNGFFFGPAGRRWFVILFARRPPQFEKGTKVCRECVKH